MEEIFQAIPIHSIYSAAFMRGSVSKSPTPDVEGHRFVWWFLTAIILSLAVHGYFFRKSTTWKMKGFTADSFDEIVPRTFHMKHVEIDPETLKEEPTKPASVRKEPAEIVVPEEGPTAGVAPVKAPGSPVPIATDLPQPVAPSPGILDRAKRSLPLDDLVGSKTTIPVAAGDPLADLPSANGSGTSSLTTLPGYSSLDGLMEGTGSLSTATAPILMPTDLLFEYDSATLKNDAELSLKKLGSLIAKNPASKFRIEGHTDSFGGDEYNQALSLRRAEEVKRWLVSKMGIAPDRITTAGLGRTRLLVPGTGTIAEQQLNRRVEIVITKGEEKP